MELSFNSLIVLIDHLTGFFQMIGAYLDDFNFADPAGSIGQIIEFLQTALNFPV